MLVSGYWGISEIDKYGHISITKDLYVEEVDFEQVRDVIEHQRVVKEEKALLEKYKGLERKGIKVIESYNADENSGYDRTRKFNTLPEDLKIAMMKPRKIFIVKR